VGTDVLLQTLNRGKPSKAKEFTPEERNNITPDKNKEKESSYIHT
jgi:hypothetical protein